MDLNHFRVAVIASDGFEEAELLEPVKALKNAGADVEIISLKPGVIQGYRHQEKATRVQVDKTIGEVQPAQYDALLLPGGAINADTMRSDQKVLDFVRLMDETKKPIAAICHAPWILISAGLADNRMLTSYHTIKDDLKNAGAHYVDQMVVVDRNWVTSRQPDDIPAFNREFLKLIHTSQEHLQEMDFPESA
jgi:protease I